MSPNILTLQKSDRICSQSRITHLFTSGESLFVYPFKVCYAPNGSIRSRFLISVPKKSFKRAVQRNYIKRLVREALRIKQFATTFEQGLDICLVYTPATIPDHTLITNKIENVLDKIKNRIEAGSNITTDTIG